MKCKQKRWYHEIDTSFEDAGLLIESISKAIQNYAEEKKLLDLFPCY